MVDNDKHPREMKHKQKPECNNNENTSVLGTTIKTSIKNKLAHPETRL